MYADLRVRDTMYRLPVQRQTANGHGPPTDQSHQTADALHQRTIPGDFCHAPPFQRSLFTRIEKMFLVASWTQPFLPRDATQSAVLLRQSRPSVTLTYPDHMGWKSSSKIISRSVNLGCSLSADPNVTDLLQREHPEILTQSDQLPMELSVADIQWQIVG